jgi:DNA-binding NarL/FixJ family response regulator
MKANIPLTREEIRILSLIKKGFSNKRISSEMGRSVNTVKYHLKNIYKKLQVNNRIEAINESMQVL